MGERLAGKIAIVTGAGSRGPGVGDGKAAAILMAREGARVLCVWDRVMAVDLKSMLLATQAGVAIQLAPKAIRVNAIAPGTVWTPMVEDLGPEMRERRRKAIPLGVEGTAWDIGWAAVYLASAEARWITGQTLVVDGGLTLTTR